MRAIFGKLLKAIAFDFTGHDVPLAVACVSLCSFVQRASSSIHTLLKQRCRRRGLKRIPRSSDLVKIRAKSVEIWAKSVKTFAKSLKICAKYLKILAKKAPNVF